MSKVSITGILENSSSIIAKNMSFAADLAKINEECNKIEKACNDLISYNGRLATHKNSTNTYVPGTNNQEIAYITTTWYTWNISGMEPIISALNSLKESTNQLHAYLNNMGIQAKNAEQSATDIEEYNNNVETALASGATASSSTLVGAFKTLKNNIAWDEYSAASGNWEGVKEENEQWWTDKLLRFVKDEKTGAYLVEQQDENGNWVGMGWTDKSTALAYIAAFDEEQAKKEAEAAIAETDPYDYEQEEVAQKKEQIKKISEERQKLEGDRIRDEELQEDIKTYQEQKRNQKAIEEGDRIRDEELQEDIKTYQEQKHNQKEIASQVTTEKQQAYTEKQNVKEAAEQVAKKEERTTTKATETTEKPETPISTKKVSLYGEECTATITEGAEGERTLNVHTIDKNGEGVTLYYKVKNQKITPENLNSNFSIEEELYKGNIEDKGIKIDDNPQIEKSNATTEWIDTNNIYGYAGGNGNRKMIEK